MFGTDFNRFNKSEEKSELNNQPTITNEIQEELRNYTPKYQEEEMKKTDKPPNFLVKVLFYFANQDLLSKFLEQFHIGGDSFEEMMETLGMKVSVLYGDYKDHTYALSLWQINPDQRFKNFNDLFFKETHMTIIYYDINNPDYILDVKDIIKKIKEVSKSKFMLVIDKNIEDQNLDQEIKQLLDSGMISLIHHLDQKEDNNNDRLVKEIVDSGAMDLYKT